MKSNHVHVNQLISHVLVFLHLNFGSFSLFVCMMFYAALNIRSVTSLYFLGDTSTNKDIYIIFKVFGRPDLRSYPSPPVPDADALTL